MTKMTNLLIGIMLIAAGCSGNTETNSEGMAPNNNAISTSASNPKVETAVMPGIEVLAANNFAQLQGKRVGLITNPTGVDNSLKSTIDILHEAPGVELTALFAPEHGVRGDYVAGAAVANEVDAKTGVKVYSLHGKTKKPTAEMLKNVDVLVYDIQDIGTRSYTFISTMGKAMEAAAENGKEFMVLDRPNPLGGNKVEGCVVEPGCFSFVSQYSIPYIYGLTPGELAQYLNENGALAGNVKAKLTVIPMKGWKRDMTFADTGMPWVLPPPHIPTPETALLYPATGIMGELDYVSIGVGYTLPFKLTGATWINAQRLAENLTGLKIPGVEFRPIHYKPFYAIFKGENLNGVEIYITDASVAPLSLIQFYIMQELAAMNPAKKPFASATQARLNMFDKVTGSTKIRQLFGKNYKVADMESYWNKDVEQWKAKVAKYKLYE